MLRWTCLAIAFAIGLAGCGGGGDDPTPPGDFDLTGTWTVTEVPNDNCFGDPPVAAYRLFAEQNGSSVTVTDERGRSYTGTLSGNQLIANVPFSYGEDGGTTTVSQLTINVQSNNQLSGNSTWSWSDGFESCNGTSSFQANK